MDKFRWLHSKDKPRPLSTPSKDIHTGMKVSNNEHFHTDEKLTLAGLIICEDLFLFVRPGSKNSTKKGSGDPLITWKRPSGNSFLTMSINPSASFVRINIFAL